MQQVLKLERLQRHLSKSNHHAHNLVAARPAAACGQPDHRRTLATDQRHSTHRMAARSSVHLSAMLANPAVCKLATPDTRSWLVTTGSYREHTAASKSLIASSAVGGNLAWTQQSP